MYGHVWACMGMYVCVCVCLCADTAHTLKRYADKMVSLAKKDTVVARKQALRVLQSREAMHKLFGITAPRLRDRQGGYTRVVKAERRLKDAAPMVFIELMDMPGPFIPYPTSGVKARRRAESKAEAARIRRRLQEDAAAAAGASSP